LGINLWNYLSSNNAIKIALAGSEKSTQKKIPATHATGTITLKNLSQSKDTNLSETEQETLSSEISSVNAAKGTTITIDVGTLKTSVLIPSATTASTAAQLVAKHLNGAGAPVKAVANGAVVTLTSLASGGKANLPLAVSATGNFKIVASGKTLTGGKNASTVTQYDSGTVNFATHGATATADWGRSSTSKIIAAKLATSINKVAGTYWKATASGAVITLTSTSKPSVEASSDSADASGVTVKDSAGFTPASFSATTK